ncbi:Crp/Fnr family transcriptional regulator [Actinoplanes sp. N902-109]|uniref:Crp/Fnr family transcriptional regulator n=1 Tax=Actinoplanes sp. (strain N902-109) TaxID=649831 RepID=UPI0005A14036|nr:Crp/Fnr family transcriptional regulator [Actinoplanes sp. N902-109]
MSEFVAGITPQLAGRVPPSDWAELVASGVPVHFTDGQILFHQGDAGRYVYVMRRGAAKVIRSEADGGQAILTVRSVGDVLGDMAALDKGVRSATVVALGRVLAQMVTAEHFRAFVSRPSVAPAFAMYTVERLRESGIQRSELALLPVRVRLARILLRLVDDAVVRMAQHDLARYAGASRNAVVEELGALRSAGIIDTRRRMIVVLRMEELRQVAGL